MKCSVPSPPIPQQQGCSRSCTCAQRPQRAPIGRWECWWWDQWPGGSWLHPEALENTRWRMFESNQTGLASNSPDSNHRIKRWLCFLLCLTVLCSQSPDSNVLFCFQDSDTNHYNIVKYSTFRKTKPLLTQKEKLWERERGRLTGLAGAWDVHALPTGIDGCHGDGVGRVWDQLGQ